MNYAEQGKSPMRHAVGISIVVVLHVILIYFLANGLGQRIIDKLQPPVQTKIVEEVKTPPPPPPPPPDLPPPPPDFIPPPDVPVPPPPQAAPAIQAVQRTVVTPYTGPAKPAPQAAPDHDVGERPIAGPPLEYPPQMEEEQREGSARVSCDVDTDGHTSNCRLDSTSGGAAFGTAALAYVKRARYQPRTHNGVPVASSHQWNIKFKLGD